MPTLARVTDIDTRRFDSLAGLFGISAEDLRKDGDGLHPRAQNTSSEYAHRTLLAAITVDLARALLPELDKGLSVKVIVPYRLEKGILKDGGSLTPQALQIAMKGDKCSDAPDPDPLQTSTCADTVPRPRGPDYISDRVDQEVVGGRGEHAKNFNAQFDIPLEVDQRRGDLGLGKAAARPMRHEGELGSRCGPSPWPSGAAAGLAAAQPLAPMHRLALCAAAGGQAYDPGLAGLLSEQDLFDCAEEANKWRSSWSVQRQEWCCSHRRVGCAAESGGGPADPAAAASRVLADGSSFDCREDIGTWESSWGPERKRWCCSNMHVACPWQGTEGGGQGQDQGHGGATPATRDGPREEGVARESERERERAESPGARVTTLKPRSTATSSAAAPDHRTVDFEKAESPGARVTTPKPQSTPTSSAAAPDHRTADFDCRDNLASWKHKWSLEQKAWCCSHHRLGCEYSFDCRSGFHSCKTGWSDVKKQWCRLQGVVCGSDAYDWVFDCQEGFSNMGNGWSDWKKRWCCKHRSVGCEATTTTVVSGLHDCTQDLKDFQVKWHWRKQKWCCEHLELGCIGENSPFSIALAARNKSHWDCEESKVARANWTLEQREWCAEHPSAPRQEDEDRHEHFDCPRDAPPEKVDGWSIDHKARWRTSAAGPRGPSAARSLLATAPRWRSSSRAPPSRRAPKGCGAGAPGPPCPRRWRERRRASPCLRSPCQRRVAPRRVAAAAGALAARAP
ncbi:unnamed protein product [Prorocentrum cordatum]|uniref:Uncharacterized protein n=1 Tax=Prorocentrum cordatum TaxID=2364126 RepID=A0ABN9T664_9DINO|nr:unnamed protein product [Polarella glacialis]